jgi:tRNA(fMet)-specific endonuclease VapC
MGRLIDTSIFIESERGRLDLNPHIKAHGDDGLFMSVVTASELLHGVYRARPEMQTMRSATIEGWIGQFNLLDIDLRTARTHARIFADLKASGQIIGSHDMWLAASCLAYGLIMITANTREFGRIPGLQIEDWSSPN